MEQFELVKSITFKPLNSLKMKRQLDQDKVSDDDEMDLDNNNNVNSNQQSKKKKKKKKKRVHKRAKISHQTLLSKILSTNNIKIVVLPNIIIQIILEIRLHHLNNQGFKSVLNLIINYSLVSKMWNQDIFPKLRLGNISISNYTKFVTLRKWIEITEKYQIKYQIILSDSPPFGRQWSQHLLDTIDLIKDKVIESTYIDCFRSYKNIQKMNMELSSSNSIDINSLLVQKFKFIENVDYRLMFIGGQMLSAICGGGGRQGERNVKENTMEFLFRRNIFTSLALKDLIFSNINIKQGVLATRLSHLSFEDIEFKSTILCIIIESAPNLKKLSLDAHISGNATHIDEVLTTLANHQELENLYLNLNQNNPKIYVQSIVSFLNKVKCSDINIELSQVHCDTIENLHSFEIYNPNIKVFRFYNSGESTREEQYSKTRTKSLKFNIFDIWSSKSSLLNISIPSDTLNLEGLSNLNSLNISVKDTKDIPNALYQIIQHNIPSLKSIYILKQSSGFEDKNYKAYQSNLNILEFQKIKYISHFTVSDLLIKETIDLIACNNSIITHITIHEMYIKNDEYQLPTLITLIRHNKTIKSLGIRSISHDLSIKSKHISSYEIVRDIIKVNGTLEKLEIRIYPSAKSKESVFSPHDFETILSQNKTIQQLYFSEHYNEASNLCKKYNVSFNSIYHFSLEHTTNKYPFPNFNLRNPYIGERKTDRR